MILLLDIDSMKALYLQIKWHYLKLTQWGQEVSPQSPFNVCPPHQLDSGQPCFTLPYKYNEHVQTNTTLIDPL